MKVLYFDVETTGLDPVKNDVIQIAGIIEIGNEVKMDFCMNCQPFSYDNITQEALDINGYTIEQIKTFDSPGAVYRKLIGIFEKYIDRFDKSDKFYPAGQNVRFDVDFLKQFFIKNDDKYYGSWLNYHYVDLLYLAAVLKYAGKIDVENLKLETIAEYFGFKFKAHDALADITTTRLILKQIIGGYLK